MTTETTNNTPKLETETCSRCGGSGHYSYCQMYGTKCFKCLGKGVVLSKRGATASKYLTEIRSRPASEIKAGDIIRMGSVTMSGTPFSKFTRVIKVEPDTTVIRSFVNGVEIPSRTDLLTIFTEMCTYHGVTPETLIRFQQTPEQSAETLARAIEYQNTLTKAGTPRKR